MLVRLLKLTGHGILVIAGFWKNYVQVSFAFAPLPLFDRKQKLLNSVAQYGVTRLSRSHMLSPPISDRGWYQRKSAKALVPPRP
jgi:hypothetical protein